VNPFVEECRREWKRLGVPDAVANEMAADLEVDLAEAEADGTSAEEVLGTGAFDAPAFAAAWAAERGVIPPPTPSPPRTRARRSRVPYVIAGFAVVALVGLVLALLPQPTVSARLALGASVHARVVPWSIRHRVRIAGQGGLVRPSVRPTIIVPQLPAGASQVVVANTNWIVLRILGIVLLVIGLAGTVLTTLYMVRGSRRRPAAAG
jgi:hypothetical protein